MDAHVCVQDSGVYMHKCGDISLLQKCICMNVRCIYMLQDCEYVRRQKMYNKFSTSEASFIIARCVQMEVAM